MKNKLKIPIKVQIYNKGSIFFSKNTTVKITKNIDTRYYFIHNYIKDEIIEIEFVQMFKEKSEIITKNF